MNICLVENCNKEQFCKGYCNRHYQQFHKYGKIMSSGERTKFDPNEIIIETDICRMKLYNIKNKEIAETIFYLKYKSEIEQFKWRLNNYGYVQCSWYDENNQRHEMQLHQYIVYLSGQTVENKQEIDHKDNNKLNNLDDNLRICSHIQNNQNKLKPINNTSGDKGVSWHIPAKKWSANIMNNGEYEHLGLFIDKEDAAKAYNEAALIYHGEFAVLNNI